VAVVGTVATCHGGAKTDAGNILFGEASFAEVGCAAWIWSGGCGISSSLVAAAIARIESGSEDESHSHCGERTWTAMCHDPGHVRPVGEVLVVAMSCCVA